MVSCRQFSSISPRGNATLKLELLDDDDSLIVKAKPIIKRIPQVNLLCSYDL